MKESFLGKPIEKQYFLGKSHKLVALKSYRNHESIFQSFFFLNLRPCLQTADIKDVSVNIIVFFKASLFKYLNSSHFFLGRYNMHVSLGGRYRGKEGQLLLLSATSAALTALPCTPCLLCEACTQNCAFSRELQGVFF